MTFIPDRLLAQEVQARLDAAKAHLRMMMEERGLYASDGWTILELAREAAEGTSIILRPLHRKLPSPEDLECTVSISTRTASVESDCP